MFKFKFFREKMEKAEFDKKLRQELEKMWKMIECLEHAIHNDTNAIYRQIGTIVGAMYDHNVSMNREFKELKKKIDALKASNEGGEQK